MGKSVINATPEERKEMTLNLYNALAKYYALYKGMEDVTIEITKEEVTKCSAS